MYGRHGRTWSGCSTGWLRLRRSSARRSISPFPRPTPRSGRCPGSRRARRCRRSTPSSSAGRRPSVAEEPGGQPPENEQQLIEELQAELRRLKVSDLLLQTLYTVSSLGYHRLSGEDEDLEQARLAIEALRALLPVLEGAVPEEATRDFQQVLSNMQLAYASAVGEGGE